MKGMNKYIALLLLAVVVAGSVWGVTQYRKLADGREGKTVETDGRPVLRKLYQHLYDNEAYDQEGNMLLYDREKGRELVEQTPFRSIRMGDAFYTQLAGQFTYVCKEKYIQVDTVTKVITVSEAIPVTGGKSLQSGLLPFEQFLEDTAAFKIKVTAIEKDGQHTLRIINELMPEVKSTTIFYDPVTYAISKMMIEWWKYPPGSAGFNTKAVWENEIIYQYGKTDAIDICEEAREIVQVRRHKVEARGRYQDYEIVTVQ